MHMIPSGFVTCASGSTAVGLILIRIEKKCEYHKGIWSFTRVDGHDNAFYSNILRKNNLFGQRLHIPTRPVSKVIRSVVEKSVKAAAV